MERLTSDRRLALVAVAALLVLALAGQAASDAFHPVGDVASTGRLVGRAGFAYVTGLRTFAAAVLWNRLDPVFHDYYEGALADQDWVMPNIRLVLALDPQFTQAYYLAPWILAKKGRIADAVALAEEGVEQNPHSAYLRVSYAQLVWVFEKDVQRAARIIEPALEEEWDSVSDAFEGYRIMATIFREAGMETESAAAMREYERVKKMPGAAELSEDHDHDGDGKPDH